MTRTDAFEIGFLRRKGQINMDLMIKISLSHLGSITFSYDIDPHQYPLTQTTHISTHNSRPFRFSLQRDQIVTHSS